MFHLTVLSLVHPSMTSCFYLTKALMMRVKKECLSKAIRVKISFLFSPQQSRNGKELARVAFIFSSGELLLFTEWKSDWLNLLFLVQYGVNQLTRDRKHLEGLFFASLWNDLMDATGMNVTYVPETTLGSCSPSGDGYDGVLHSIHSNLSDWSFIMLSELACPLVDEFSFGPVYGESSNKIVHTQKRRTRMDKLEDPLDIITDLSYERTARVVDCLINLTLFCLLVASLHLSRWFFESAHRILRPYSRKVNTSMYLRLLQVASYLAQVFTRQSFSPRGRCISLYLISYILMVHSFLVSVIYFSIFKTDLFQPQATVRLNTLQDLAESDRPAFKAIFPSQFNTWQRFARSQHEPYKSIWERATADSQPLVDFAGSDLLKTFASFHEKHLAVITMFANSRFLIDAYCLMHESNLYPFQLYQSADSFLGTFNGIIMRKMLDSHSKRFISLIFLRIGQHGFQDYYIKNPQGLLRKTPEQLKCYRELEEERNAKTEDRVHELSLRNFTTLLWVSVFIVTLAFATLLIEHCWTHWPPKKPKKRCVTISLRKVRVTFHPVTKIVPMWDVSLCCSQTRRTVNIIESGVTALTGNLAHSTNWVWMHSMHFNAQNSYSLCLSFHSHGVIYVWYVTN